MDSSSADEDTIAGVCNALGLTSQPGSVSSMKASVAAKKMNFL